MEKFDIKCKACGSHNVDIDIGAADYEDTIRVWMSITCKDCGNEEVLEDWM